jgi:hypothetical protein
VPKIDPILEIVKKHDVVLASGHIFPAEIFVLVEAAQKKSIDRIVITHPSDAKFMEKTLTLEGELGGKVITSKDFVEGRAAFMEKRKPVYIRAAFVRRNTLFRQYDEESRLRPYSDYRQIGRTCLPEDNGRRCGSVRCNRPVEQKGYI